MALSARHAGRVWQMRDPRGRTVVLTPERWLHVLIEHGDLTEERDTVLSAVAEPTVVRRGRAANEVHYFRARVGPSSWLQVVVHYHDETGRITTDFGRRWLP